MSAISSAEECVLNLRVAAVLNSLLYGVLVLDDGGGLVHANGVARIALAERGATGESLGHAVQALRRRPGTIVTMVETTAGASWEVICLAGAPHRVTLRDHEQRLILLQLAATGWRVTESARRLGISRSTLWRRLRRYGVREGDPVAVDL